MGKIYTLGLNQGGSVEFVMGLMADNIDEAKQEWARVTGHIDPLWNEKNKTYFGWKVIETKKSALQRKSNPNPFQS